MERTDHHGIPTFWQHAPPPFTAALLLRVGVQDETFRTYGVTHAMEHLAMAAQPVSRLDSNASVGTSLTAFHASGPETAVAEFLNDIAATLATLPLDDLDRELRVLDAEGWNSSMSALGFAAIDRYGSTGAGLISGIGVPPQALRASDIEEHVRTHVVRGNAALIMTGPPPAALDVHLPDGPQPARAPADPLPWPYPHFRREAAPFCILAYTNPRRASLDVLTAVLVHRLEAELRGRQGIVYSVDHDSVDVDLRTTLTAISVETREAHASTVAMTLWDELRTLARTPPTQTEVDDAVDVVRALLDDPRNVGDLLIETARHHLDGNTQWSADVSMTATESARPADVRGCAAAVAESALLVVPTRSGPEPEAMVDFHQLDPPAGPQGSGTHFSRRLWSRAPMDFRVTVSDDGISQRVRGTNHGVYWRDVVGVERSSDHRSIITRQSTGFDLLRRDVRDPERLFAIIDAHAGDLAFDGTAPT